MPEFSVVLIEPKYEGNIGSVARVMKNFGFNELVLVNPSDIGKEARAMAMHGIDVLENAKILKYFDELKDKFDFLIATSAIIASDRNFIRTPILPEELKNAIGKDGKIGLVFGREDYGLLNDEISLCDMLVSIPANPEYPTLNISQSVAIILYEISKFEINQKIMNLKKFKTADKTEKEILLKKFDELADLAYEEGFHNRISKKAFRQIIGRAFISGREAFTLTGVFRKSAEKIRKN